MAAISPTVSILEQVSPNIGPAITYTWTGVTEADTFVAAEVPLVLPDRTVHIFGTFGSATVVINGSINGSTYTALNDQSDNALSKTAAAIESIAQLTRYVQPTHSGGTSESVTVILLAGGPRRV